MREQLSKREQEVYEYLIKGLNYSQMQELLGINKTTILTHAMHIFLKKMVSSRYELMAQRINELEREVFDLKRTKSNTRA